MLNEAVILAGGKGTRLQSIVDDRPKPLAEVLGRPFLEWLILNLSAKGFCRIILCVGYMHEKIQAMIGDGKPLGVEVVYAVDPFPLGTGGALRNALKYIQHEKFLVLNGDSYCHFDESILIKTHEERKAKATIWLIDKEGESRYGLVKIDAQGAVLNFSEKSTEHKTGLINAGIYLLEKSAVETIPDNCSVSMEREFFPAMIGRGLYAAVGTGPFLDIGTPESYKMATEFLEQDFRKLVE